MTVSQKEFVEIWNSAENREQVARRCGITINGASSRATYYRSKGVMLKQFHKGTPNRLNVEELNQFIQELQDLNGPPSEAERSCQVATELADKNR